MQDNIVWHPEVLPPDARETFAALGTHPAVKPFYLAGGTALALQWRQRKSAQLDFGKELMSLFQQKFAKTTLSKIHLLKSLTYFADAEKEPMPNMLQPISWEEVKQFFITQVPLLRS